MIPMTFQQTRSTQIMSALAPALDIINKKYANNTEKRNSETLKLYQRYNYQEYRHHSPSAINAGKD